MGMFDKNISAEKKASLEFAEEQRESEWKYPSFAGQIFQGKVDWRLIHPFPSQSAEEKRKGDEYIAKLKDFLLKNLDPNEVDRTHLIPDHVMKGLGELKAFAIKIPEEYGGFLRGGRNTG
jgi:alkylation response protein AidB-like acyl-CoA dehydrogenase